VYISFRGLHLSTTKIQALDVLLELSTYCSAETVLDRIVPYIVSQIFIIKVNFGIQLFILLNFNKIKEILK